MFKRILNSINQSYRQETLRERSKRMIPGSIYCIIASSMYIFVSSIINVFFFPGMHLGVDWINLLTRWVEYILVFALAGAIVGWFTEEYIGIVGGGVVLTILVLIGNLVASVVGRGSPALTLQSIFTALPLVGVGILLAWLIRVAINRHLLIQLKEKPAVRRNLAAQMLIIVILVGLIPGVLSRFGYSSEYAIRTLNRGMQNFATDPLFQYRYPFAKVPGLKTHFGMNYTLFVYSSSYEANDLDVTIQFEDGYAISCIVPVTSADTMILQVCNEGSRIITP